MQSHPRVCTLLQDLLGVGRTMTPEVAPKSLTSLIRWHWRRTIRMLRGSSCHLFRASNTCSITQSPSGASSAEKQKRARCHGWSSLSAMLLQWQALVLFIGFHSMIGGEQLRALPSRFSPAGCDFIQQRASKAGKKAPSFLTCRLQLPVPNPKELSGSCATMLPMYPARMHQPSSACYAAEAEAQRKS